MKIYYDSCQTYGGSENNTRFFDAAYNKPRLSARSARAEPPAGGVLLRSGRTYPPNHLSITLSALLASSSPAVTLGADTGRSAPAGCFQGSTSPLWSLAGTRCCLPPICCPNKSSSLCPLTPVIPYTTSTCSCWFLFIYFFLNAHWLPCSPSPPTHLPPHLLLFQLCCSQTQGPNKTLHRMVNVLINVKAWWHQHTLTQLLVTNTDVALLICPQVEHFEPRAESICCLGLRGR